MLDELLKQLIAAHLLPCAGQETLFSGAAAPLSFFSSRIDLAHRIGLISPRLARDLHLIRRIRNDFAHTFDELTFASAPIAQRVQELAKSNGIAERNPSLDPAITTTPDGQFFIAASWIATFLTAYIEDDVEPFNEARLEWGYTTTTFEE